MAITSGLQALRPEFCQRALDAVRDFTAFTEDNDPGGEHDFGNFLLDGHELCWKIDYLDLSLMFDSPDPRDSAYTRRLLTIMFLSEY